MKCKIHRGAHEIGGSCFELEAAGKRIVLDVGLPLEGNADDVELPAVAGLADGDDPDLLGVCVSHPHPDHFGLMAKVSPSVPVYIGAAATRILAEAAFFTRGGVELEATEHFEHGKPLTIGPFTITPFLNDHSAFDTYSLLVEAEGRRLFYSADLRGHGRKAKLFEALLASPPENIHVLLMEGTNIRGPESDNRIGPTEIEVEAACTETFKATEGIVLCAFSPQNVDRLVSMYKAARKSGRKLVVDLYTAEIARATGRPDSIPQAEWDGVRVYLPKSQKKKILDTKAFDKVNRVKAQRIYPEELPKRKGDLAMIFRPSMIGDLDNPALLKDGAIIWSMWHGYLQSESGMRLDDWRKQHGMPLKMHHSSGHASVRDLQRLAEAISAERIVPVHTFSGDRFDELFNGVDRRNDGEWWEV